MKENLVFGVDICAYGAVGDGKTDCREAFQKAIDNGENLICIPFGTYLVKGSIILGSNVKIHAHPKAQIIFDTSESVLITNRDKKLGNSAIIICGGIWKTRNSRKDSGSVFFGFAGVGLLQLCGLELHHFARIGIDLFNVRNFKLTDVTSKAQICEYTSDFIRIDGGCCDGIIRGVRFYGCEKQCDSQSVLTFGNKTTEAIKTSNIRVEGVHSEHASGIVKLAGKDFSDICVHSVTGSFRHSCIEVSDKASECEDIEIEEIHTFSESFTKDSSYIILDGTFDGLEIVNFRRNGKCEAYPLIPTLRLDSKSVVSLTLDGSALDEIIAAKGASSVSDMTTAKLATPEKSFIYTVEATVAPGGNFTMPYGSFNLLNINQNN